MKRNLANLVVGSIRRSGVGCVTPEETTDTSRRAFNDLLWLAVRFCILHYVREMTRDEDRTIPTPLRLGSNVEWGLRRHGIAPTWPTGLRRYPVLRIPQDVARTAVAPQRTVPSTVISAPRDSEPPPSRSEHGHAGDEGIALVELAQLPERTVLDKKRLASLLGVTVRTVSNIVDRGELPAPVELAGRKVWLSGMVLSHIERRATEAAERAEKDRKRVSKLKSRKLM